jgi:hypothetical protein
MNKSNHDPAAEWCEEESISLKRLALAITLLRPQPHQSFEQEIVHNMNVSVGTFYRF